jgi:BMFP domain-containing protein YqiC
LAPWGGDLAAGRDDRHSPVKGLDDALTSRAENTMTQTSNRLFDEFARLMNDAAGMASGVRREFDTLVRHQAERILRDLDLVRREELEAVKEMARLAREENEALQARIAALEAKPGANAWPPATMPGSPDQPAPGPDVPPRM